MEDKIIEQNINTFKKIINKDPRNYLYIDCYGNRNLATDIIFELLDNCFKRKK